MSKNILTISCSFIRSALNYRYNKINKIQFWGVFTDTIKYAVLKPLHRNGERCDVYSYRPVSLVTTFSKIFEMVMQKRVLKHHINYHVLSTEQYGFGTGL